MPANTTRGSHRPPHSRLDRLLRFDRSDFGISFVVIAFLAAAVPVYTLVMPLATWARGTGLVGEIDLSGQRLGETQTAPGAEVLSAGVGRARFETLDTQTFLAYLAPGLVLTVATLLVACLLWHLLRSIQSGDPFITASVWRLRGIAGVLLLAPPLHAVASAFSLGSLTHAALVDSPPGLLFLLSPAPLMVMGVGLLLAALAEAFRRGTDLERDVEGLV